MSEEGLIKRGPGKNWLLASELHEEFGIDSVGTNSVDIESAEDDITGDDEDDDSVDDDEELDRIIAASSGDSDGDSDDDDDDDDDDDEAEEEAPDVSPVIRPPFDPPTIAIQELLAIEPEPPLFAAMAGEPKRIMKTASAEPVVVATTMSAKTRQQTGVKRANATSQYLGVSYNARAKRWTSQGSLGNGRRMPCRSFKTEVEAAQYYDSQQRECGLPKALLNFPDGVKKSVLREIAPEPPTVKTGAFTLDLPALIRAEVQRARASGFTSITLTWDQLDAILRL